MSGAAHIEAAAARARQAGRALRERPLDERIEAIGALLDAWSEPEGRWQRSLVQEHAASTGFHEDTVREGLALGLADWNSETLLAAAARELPAMRDEPGQALAPALTAVLLAGAIPMPSILQLLAPLIVGSPVLAKAASRDPVTPARLVDSLRSVDPELAGCIEVVELEGEPEGRRFFSAPVVVASGSDATIEAVRRQLSAGQRLIAHGHKLSVAVLGSSALGPKCAAQLALDAGLWDQLGCLSPIAVYVVGAETAALSRFAESVAEAFAAREERMPRGAVDAEAAVAIRTERDEARIRIAARGAGAIHESPGSTAWTVVLEADAEPRPAPLHRFLRIHPVNDEAGLGRALQPLAAYLSSVAVAGFPRARLTGVASRLAGLGASRVCRPGRLQAPPLGWHHDGLPLFAPLLKLCDFEF